MKIILYTDGSSRGNPGPGGWGCVLMTECITKSDDGSTADREKVWVKEFGGGDKHTTNNKMELLATINGLTRVNDFLGKSDVSQVKEIEVHTDSQYVKNGISVWIHGWIKNGWKTSAKKEVLNKDLWERLLDAKKNIEERGVHLTFHYVKAHNGHLYNDRVDIIATTFADKIPTKLYDGEKEDYKKFLESICA